MEANASVYFAPQWITPAHCGEEPKTNMKREKTTFLCVHIIAGHQGAIKMFYSNWLKSHCGHENDSAFPAVRSSTSHCDLSGKPALPRLFTLIYWFIDWTVLITWILPDKLAAVVHILAATEVIQSEMAYSVENVTCYIIKPHSSWRAGCSTCTFF